MHPGDTVTIGTPGGGGWGDPLKRDPAAVVRDVCLGLISETQAAQDYAVAVNQVDGTWQCDVERTAAMRSPSDVSASVPKSVFNRDKNNSKSETADVK